MPRRHWQALALVGLAVAAFWPALRNGPIEDDLPLVHERLAAVRAWGDLPALLGQSYWGNMVAGGGGLWRPLTLVTLGIERLAFGDAFWAYRLVSLALHAACTLLVYRLAGRLVPGRSPRRTSRRRWLAFAAAGLFAVHPIHAEVVATIYGQAELWAAVFALLAIVADVAWRRSGRSAARWAGIAALFLLSLGFKESALLLPVSLWLLAGDRRWWRRDLRVGIVAAGWLVYWPIRRAVLGEQWTPPITVGGEGPGAWLVTVAVALATDLRLLMWPTGQTIYYGHLRDSLAAAGTLEFVALAAVAWAVPWAWRSTGRSGRAGLLLMAAFLLPVSNVVPIGMLVAERTLYLPSVGFVLLAATIGSKQRRTRTQPTTSRSCNRMRVGLRPTLAIGTVALALVQCWRVSHRWCDERTAWEASLCDHPRSARTAAEVVRLRLDDPAFVVTPAERLEMHRLLDGARALTPDSPRVFEVMARLAADEGDSAAAAEFTQKARRFR